MKTTLALILALTSTLIISGCAGSAADRDFRSKVQEVDVKESANFDPVTKSAGGTIGARFIFRDPNQGGLAK